MADPKLGPSKAASLLKNQGNLAFKAGDFAKAVEHYTAAMKADPSDAILPCNRSMAHLKLKQWREAARDATKSLELQPSGNGKALFRRATARKGLGDVNAALSDFEAALALDPKNESILAELKEMKARAQPRPTAKPATSSTQPSAPPRPQPAVAEPATSTSTERLRTAISSDAHPDALLREVSTTRKGKSPERPKVQQAPPSPAPKAKQPATEATGFAGLKKVRQDRQAGRSAALASTSTVKPRPPPPIPRTDQVARVRDFVDFERRWTSDKDEAVRWQILKALPLDSLDVFFGEHLEPETLEEMVRSTTSQPSDDLDVRIFLLDKLSGIPRFDLLSMFLANETREGVRQLCAAASRDGRPVPPGLAQAWSIASS